MSLSSILDDIQGDVTNDSDMSDSSQVTAVGQTQVNPALEALSGIAVLNNKVQESQKKAYIKRSFETALESSVIDKSTALELFTMLPLGQSLPPVLTQVASRHNRKQVEDLYNLHGVKEVDAEVKYEVIGLIQQSEHVWEETHHACEIFLKDFKYHLERLEKNPPVVIYKGKTVNLLNCDMLEVSSMNTSQLDYPPYEGILDANYRCILNDSSLMKMRDNAEIARAVPEEFSLLDIVRHLIGLCNADTAKHNNIHRLGKEDGLINETDLGVALSSLDWYRKHHSLFIGSDALADKVLKCGVGFLV